MATKSTSSVVIRDWIRNKPLLAKPAKAFLRNVGKALQYSRIKAYMNANSARKLQIGAHLNVLDTWLNTDLYPQHPGIVFLDACSPFPFPSQSFDYIFTEHQLEHLSYEDGRKMVGQCFKTLKPGGKIRIAVPSLDPLVALYATTERSQEQESYVRSQMRRFPTAPDARPGYAINGAFLFWGHKFMYDRETLQDLLEGVGFKFNGEYKPSMSDDPHLTGIEFRTSVSDSFETMVLEFVRPL